MNLLVAAVLVLLFSASGLLGLTSRSVHAHELKRRARNNKDSKANSLYKMISYGTSLDLLLWLTGSLSGAALVLIAAKASGWFVVLAALLAGWFFWRNAPTRISNLQWGLSAAIAPAVTGVLSALQPVLGPAAGWLEKRNILPPHTKIYEKEDLLELLQSQAHQMDNRILESELNMAASALTFGDKTVGSVMTPRRMVKMVAATDTIGPLLMDELHASGFSRFPVVKEASKTANPEVIGMLYLHELIGHADKGKVKDVMKKKVCFVNETQNLRQALAALIKTETHLAVVVNNFEEIVGVITIEDLMEQIVGEKIVDEYDQYDDLRAVAGLKASKDEDKHSWAKVVE